MRAERGCWLFFHHLQKSASCSFHSLGAVATASNRVSLHRFFSILFSSFRYLMTGYFLPSFLILCIFPFVLNKRKEKSPRFLLPSLLSVCPLCNPWKESSACCYCVFLMERAFFIIIQWGYRAPGMICICTRRWLELLFPHKSSLGPWTTTWSFLCLFLISFLWSDPWRIIGGGDRHCFTGARPWRAAHVCIWMAWNIISFANIHGNP